MSLEALQLVSGTNIEPTLEVLKELRKDLSLEKFSAIVQRGEYEFRVLVVDSEVVGVVGYRIMETITRGAHMHIHDLVVSGRFRGLGYGNQIIKILSNHCEINKLSWIFLDSAPSAIGFYEKLSFENHTATLMRLCKK